MVEGRKDSYPDVGQFLEPAGLCFPVTPSSAWVTVGNSHSQSRSISFIFVAPRRMNGTEQYDSRFLTGNLGPVGKRQLCLVGNVLRDTARRVEMHVTRGPSLLLSVCPQGLFLSPP